MEVDINGIVDQEKDDDLKSTFSVYMNEFDNLTLSLHANNSILPCGI